MRYLSDEERMILHDWCLEREEFLVQFNSPNLSVIWQEWVKESIKDLLSFTRPAEARKTINGDIYLHGPQWDMVLPKEAPIQLEE